MTSEFCAMNLQTEPDGIPIHFALNGNFPLLFVLLESGASFLKKKNAPYVFLSFLQQSMNGSAPSSFHPEDLQCRITDSQEINCSSEIYTSPNNWRTSRTFINEQIRRLRSQLFELKVRIHRREKSFVNSQTLSFGSFKK